ncbi:hypothetical protein [Geodermatophilus nigrescens]|uniref:Uncharacterized protein n=1 Tax=Geodermatophilus nigrescens TaxID=1070870 RepID=A0A1M5NC41_9ACTN|nr:hypothetical protein [Geodermatophilus nigrescens]SHG87058.1 hypothetical protein SAMN05444351_3498 [Geodermatophilus nigrescens]
MPVSAERRVRARWPVLLGVAVWLASVLFVAACWAAPSLFGDSTCELTRGSSVYGEASRSWLPPGTRCTYEAGPSTGLAEELVVDPPARRLAVVAVAVAGGPALLVLRRRASAG